MCNQFASVQKSPFWHAISHLPMGNLAEKVGTVRFFKKSCLNLYRLLRGSLSGLWEQFTVFPVPQWYWIVKYLNCRYAFFLLCVAMKGALLWQRLGSHQIQVWQWSSKQWKWPALPFLHGGSHNTNTQGFINCAYSAALACYKTTAG